MDAGVRLTRARNADGEVVASWHPDAGVKLATMLAHRAGDGGKKARSPGRLRSKPLKPLARGMPDYIGEPVVTNSCVYLHLHARLWVRRAPGIPCALCFDGVLLPDALGRLAPREQ
jgi:hypothetical protein